MNKDLYYCSAWKHQFYNNYDICVSDLIQYGGLLQIHCIATLNNEVVCGFSRKDLSSFEKNIRAHVRKFIEKMETEYIKQANKDYTVKIWYYNLNDEDLNTKDIPLRIAITFYQPRKIDNKEQEILKEHIFMELCQLLK